MTPFKISVLFSTFNRASLLNRALDSFTRQTLPKDHFEVIIINDGSTDATEQVVRNFEKKLSLGYAYQENRGLAEGKNHAIRLATASVVLFMDDDDVAEPHLLEEHLSTHTKHPQENMTVLGYTDLDSDIAQSPLMHFVTQVGYYLFCYPKIRHGDELDYTYFWGGRSSCKKNLLLQHGLFDPIFRFGCEDIELGYRLSKYGLKVIYNKNARSTMIRSLSLDEFCKRTERQGYSNWIFSQKHPTPEIMDWTGVADLDARWEVVKPKLDHYQKIAHGLEKIAWARMQYGVQLDSLLTSLLHNAYWKVINGHRIKGSWMACKSIIGKNAEMYKR